MILNSEPLEEVQVAANGGSELKMYEGYRAWGDLKSLLSNRGLGINAKICLYE